MAWVATAIIGASVVGAAGTAYAANKASDAQQQAAAQAANTQLSMYNQTAGYLAPFRNIGGQAANYLSSNLPTFTQPVTVDAASISNPNSTIGSAYNFINTQGQKAVTNSAAARGLATSGAALKGASTFAENNADTYYNDLFNMATTNQTNAFNRLQGLINTGENAAAGTGAAATATGQGVAASQTAAGNAAAAGDNAIGAASSSVASSIPNSFLTAGLYGKLTSGSTASNASTVGPPLNILPTTA